MVVFGHVVLPMVLPIYNRCHPPFAVSKDLPKMVVFGHVVLPIGAVLPMVLPISNRCHPPFG